MVAVRTYKPIFISTVILTTVIFIVGVLVGYGVDRLRTGDVLDTLQASELDAQSYQIEQEFFNTFGEYNCGQGSKRLTELAYTLGELGYYLVSFEKRHVFKQRDYDYLLRKYFLMELRTYTLLTTLKRNCQTDDLIILYFFDPDDVMSERQGRVLDVLVEEYDQLSVFSINNQYHGDVLVDSVKLHYNVTMTPTLIVNDHIRREGFIDKAELEQIFAGF